MKIIPQIVVICLLTAYICRAVDIPYRDAGSDIDPNPHISRDVVLAANSNFEVYFSNLIYFNITFLSACNNTILCLYGSGAENYTQRGTTCNYTSIIYFNEKIFSSSRFKIANPNKTPTQCILKIFLTDDETRITVLILLSFLIILIVCCGIGCVVFIICGLCSKCSIFKFENDYYKLHMRAKNYCADSMYIIDCYGCYFTLTKKNKKLYSVDVDSQILYRGSFEELKLVKV